MDSLADVNDFGQELRKSLTLKDLRLTAEIRS